MGERAQVLAATFDTAIKDLSATAESCTDAQWQAVCGGEGWTVAATVHHVGAQFGLELEYLTAAADGATPPTHTWDDINGLNESRAAKNSAISKADALKGLQEGAAKMSTYVRALSDEQLDATAPLALADGAAVSTEQLILGGVLIAHAVDHLASIRASM